RHAQTLGTSFQAAQILCDLAPEAAFEFKRHAVTPETSRRLPSLIEDDESLMKVGLRFRRAHTLFTSILNCGRDRVPAELLRQFDSVAAVCNVELTGRSSPFQVNMRLAEKHLVDALQAVFVGLG